MTNGDHLPGGRRSHGFAVLTGGAVLYSKEIVLEEPA